jgi:hypothetical protein
MPKLPTFAVQHETLTAEISGGRRATPADAGAGVGEALQGLGTTAIGLGETVQSEFEASDARKVLMRNAQIREKYGKLLDAAELSGGDTDRIRQDMDDELAGVRGEMQTQRGIMYADQHIAGTGELFNGKVAQIKVERARAEAVLGGNQLMQANASLLYSNPSYLPLAEESIDAYMATQGRIPAPLRAELAEKLKGQARVQAATRAAELDPEGMQAALKAGQWKLSPEQMAQVDKAADAEIRRRRQEARVAAEDARIARTENSNKARQEHFAAIEAAKPGEMTAVYNSIMKDGFTKGGRLDEVDQEHLVNYIRAKQDHAKGDEKQSNKVVRNNLAARIWAPYGDPNKITTDEEVYAALQRGDLNYPDFKQLVRDVAEARDANNSTYSQRRSETRNTLFRAVSQDPKYAAQPFLVAEIMNRWDALVRDRTAQERAAGRPPERLFSTSERDSVMSLDVLAQIDRDARAGQAQERTRAAGQAGVQFPDGKTRVYKGTGDRSKLENWTEVTPEQAAAAAAPRPQTTARQSFNGVVVPPATARSQSFEARIRSEYPRRRGESADTYEKRINELAQRARAAGAE